MKLFAFFIAVVTVSLQHGEGRRQRKAQSARVLQASYDYNQRSTSLDVKHRIQKMSLDEALAAVGHLMPAEVHEILAEKLSKPLRKKAAAQIRRQAANLKASVDGEADPRQESKANVQGKTNVVVEKINEMALDTIKDLDLTKIDCKATMDSLDEELHPAGSQDAHIHMASVPPPGSLCLFVQADNSRLESDLNDDQSELLQWTAKKDEALQAIQSLQDQLEEHNKECDREIASTEDLHTIIEGDYNVSSKVVAKTDCAKALDVDVGKAFIDLQRRGWQLDMPGTTKESFIQTQTLHHSGATKQTQSPVLLQCIKPNGYMFMTFQNPRISQALVKLSSKRREKVNAALLQERQDPMVNGTMSLSNGTIGVDEPDTPAQTEVPEEMADANYLEELVRNCTEIRENIQMDIDSWQRTLALANTRIGQLDARIEEINTDLEEVRKTQGLKQDALDKKKAECDTAIEEATTAICGIGKIKGDLAKMSGTPDIIEDCEVSDWEYGVCSKECGPQGGLQNLTRQVITQPTPGYGTPCPALEAEMVCNKHPCPIDCQEGSWSEFTRCSAECGNGDQYKFRDIIREPRYNGRPCDARMVVKQCQRDPCDKDCVLSEWTEYNACDVACGGGFHERRRNVLEPPTGQGYCPPAEDVRRHEEKTCNEQPCPAERPVCETKADVVLILDGSGSMSEEQFGKIKTFAKRLVLQTKLNSTTNAQIGIVLFSHWSEILSRMTDDKEKLIKKIDALKWPGDEACLASAAFHAKRVLQNGGREDAASIVHLITDGKPSGPILTSAEIDYYTKMGMYFMVPPMLTGFEQEWTYESKAAHELMDFAILNMILIGGDTDSLDYYMPLNHDLFRLEEFDELDDFVDDCVIMTCPEIANLTPLDPTASTVDRTTTITSGSTFLAHKATVVNGATGKAFYLSKSKYRHYKRRYWGKVQRFN
ncbi:unnamed protein product [Vitrella brassicaformis CCMP3155]|uniref:VWFA domain-containing protein n=3 Tax=Vitrella brassicaformis TaxID=1169539 RepID=A0A0G4EI97_VITBC|nr:unnamed protein product [Vitrella brassicaformis CCMP3155]|eukprot:CEL96722.1 unnamed protein product [Vitrella brassicaformis CCMP3155]